VKPSDDVRLLLESILDHVVYPILLWRRRWLLLWRRRWRWWRRWAFSIMVVVVIMLMPAFVLAVVVMPLGRGRVILLVLIPTCRELIQLVICQDGNLT
jgi:hypothetical protein